MPSKGTNNTSCERQILKETFHSKRVMLIKCPSRLGIMLRNHWTTFCIFSTAPTLTACRSDMRKILHLLRLVQIVSCCLKKIEYVLMRQSCRYEPQEKERNVESGERYECILVYGSTRCIRISANRVSCFKLTKLMNIVMMSCSIWTGVESKHTRFIMGIIVLVLP